MKKYMPTTTPPNELIAITGIFWLEETKGLKKPFNFPVHQRVNTEEAWDAYRWNPPGEYPYNTNSPPDPNASPKPTWQELVDANAAYKLIDRRTICLSHAYQAATQRIALLYHPEADFRPEREWQVRLSGEDVSAMDEKRERLISVYDTLKVRIENGTTVAEFDAIEADIISDLTWSTEKSNG